MNPSQRKTAIGVAIAATLSLGGGLLLLVVEFRALSRGGNSTISELVWRAWSAQPGAIFAIVVPLTLAAGVLLGHFTWQSRVVYDAQRAGVDLDRVVPVVLELRARISRGEQFPDFLVRLAADTRALDTPAKRA